MVFLAMSLGLAWADPVVVAFGTLKSTAPVEWKSEKPSNLLRAHQFKLPSADANFADGEVAVFKDGSPKVAEKFAEWKATFVPPEGKTVDDISKESKFAVGGSTVHLLDVTGTWKYRERPRDPKSKEELRPDYRVVWVIVVKDEDATHIRLSGPISVVAKYYTGFEGWLKSAK